MDALHRVYYEMCEDAVKDGVSYLEVRFAPILHTNAGLSMQKIVSTLCHAADEAQRNLPIHTRLILCGMRNFAPESTIETAKVAVKFKTCGVVGFDLAGPERGFRPSQHETAFQIAKEAGIFRTIHAGEDDTWESVQFVALHTLCTRFAHALHTLCTRFAHALHTLCTRFAPLTNHREALDLETHRIGHGVALHNSPILDRVKLEKVGIEVCITSNSLTKSCKEKSKHPVRNFFDHGIEVIPCTDSSVVNGTVLSNEYNILQRELAFRPVDLLKMASWGFEHSFVEDPHLKLELVRNARLHNNQIFQGMK
jgi:adenosine deaminase